MCNPNIYLQIVEEASESWETGKASQQGEYHQGAHETTRGTSVGIRLVSILAASWICNNDWLLCLLHFVLTDWRSSSTVLWYYYYYCNVIKIKNIDMLYFSDHKHPYFTCTYTFITFTMCILLVVITLAKVVWLSNVLWQNARVCTANAGFWVHVPRIVSYLEMRAVPH